MPHRRHYLAPETWPERYRNGATLAELADATGFSKSLVRDQLLARGVVMRPRGQPKDWHEAAFQALAGGMTKSAVARMFGVTHQAVRNMIDRRAARQAALAPVDPPLGYAVEHMGDADPDSVGS